MSSDVYINHHVAQIQGVNSQILNNPDLLMRSALQIAKDLNLTVVNTFIHKFKPHGLSLVIVISQSHIAIHTWPEYGYLHIDILTCSEHAQLTKLEEALKKVFNPQKIDSKKIDY